MKRSIRIYISSPSDVSAERVRAGLVGNRLSREFQRFFRVEVVLWEYQTMLAAGHFQDVISPTPSESDIVVTILWSRLGSPLPESTKVREYKGLDGRAPVTGTEWEVEDALRARTEREEQGLPPSPDLLVYRSDRAPVIVADRDNLGSFDEARDQLVKLEAFWHRHFQGEDGSFKLAFKTFMDLDGFEAALEADLRHLLKQKLESYADIPSGEVEEITWHQGNPFRGLRSFGMEHGPIFFGRAAAQTEIVERLIRRAAAEQPLLFVLGASGVGKSSVVQAGVANDVMAPGVVSGNLDWRRVVVRPSDGIADGVSFCRTLSDRLFELFPEFADLGVTAEKLAERLAQPDHGDLLSMVAHKRAGDNAGLDTAGGGVRLLLIVDQFEEVFSGASRLDGTGMSEFLILLHNLIESGVVWTIATMRSDYYSDLVLVPDFRPLVMDEGHVVLGPLRGAEIQQAIELPAAAAGVVYEREGDTDIPLSAVLRDDANEPNALPLLEFALEELYYQDVVLRSDDAGTVRGQLTFASYERIGGLSGAIVTKAEQAVAPYLSDMKDDVGAVLIGLVALGEEGRPVARTAAKGGVAPTPARAEILEALVDARLVTSSGGEGGSGVSRKPTTVRLAHEALLRSWPRYRDLIREEAQFLESRGRVEALAALWKADDRAASRLLNPGNPLSEGEGLFANRPLDLGEVTRAFIQASTERAAAVRNSELVKERHKRSMFQAFGAMCLLFAIGASIGAYYGWTGQQEALQQSEIAARERDNALAAEEAAGRQAEVAQEQRDVALAAEVEAERQSVIAQNERDAALAAEASVLLSRAELELENDRTSTAIQLILETLPTDQETPDRPVLASALAMLNQAFTQQRDYRVFDAGSTAIFEVAVSPDGRQLMAVNEVGDIRVFDIENGRREYLGTETYRTGYDFQYFPEYSTDSRFIFSATSDGDISRWDAETWERTRVVEESPTGRLFSSWSQLPDSHVLATTFNPPSAYIWNTETGERSAVELGVPAAVWQSSASRSGLYVAVRYPGPYLELFDRKGSGAGRVFRHSPVGWTHIAGFSPDERLLVTYATKDDSCPSDPNSRRCSIVVWESRDAEVQQVINIENPIRTVALFPSSNRLIATTKQGVASIWDYAEGTLLRVLPGRISGSGASDPVISNDESLLAIRCENENICVYEVSSGNLVMQTGENENSVVSFSFSPNGDLLAVGYRNGLVRLYQVERMRPFEDFNLGQDHSWDVLGEMGYDGLHLRWDQDQLALVSEGELRVLSPILGGDPASVSIPGEEVLGGRMSSDGTQALIGYTGHAVVLDLQTGRELFRLPGHEGAVDGWFLSGIDRIVTHTFHSRTNDGFNRGRQIGNPRLWNASTGELIRELEESDGIVWDFAQLDNRRFLLASGERPRVWSAEDGALIAEFPDPGGGRNENHYLGGAEIELRPGNSQAVVVSERISLIDTETYEWIRFYDEPVYRERTRTKFFPDGNRFVTSTLDATFLWGVDRSTPIAELERFAGEIRSIDVSEDWIVIGRNGGSVTLYDAQSGFTFEHFSTDGDVYLAGLVAGTNQYAAIGEFGLVYRDLPRVAETVTLARAKNVGPSSDQGRYLRGSTLEQLGPDEPDRVELNECDVRAGHPQDPDQPGNGIWYSDIAPNSAVSACQTAVEDSPETGRFRFQLSRAYGANGESELAYESALEGMRLGHACATSAVGWRLVEGVGVEQDIPEGVRYLEQAVQEGCDDALRVLGRYMSDLEFLDQNIDKAIEYFERNGSLFTEMRLGNLYWHEEYERQDLEKALFHYVRAEAMGYRYLYTGVRYWSTIRANIAAQLDPERTIEVYRDAMASLSGPSN